MYRIRDTAEAKEPFRFLEGEEMRAFSCVRAPALRRPKLVDGRLSESDYAETKRRIRLIFSAFLFHGVRRVVLGAWGCGIFKNPPRMIARGFAEVLREDLFKNRFEHIVFAINGEGDQSTFLRAAFAMELTRPFVADVDMFGKKDKEEENDKDRPWAIVGGGGVGGGGAGSR